tara:strand:- start:450 stop:719 length:270 start_codon:yes stop_codon:yes gene_type:complete
MKLSGFIKKSFTSFDAVIVLVVIFGVNYLIGSYSSGVINIRAISISKEFNPTGYWLIFTLFIGTYLASIFYFIFYDFKSNKFTFCNKSL